MEELDFLVRRDNLAELSWGAAQTRSDAALEPGEVLVRIERYALTANNITYGVVGDAMRYWEFFPATDGWGRLPVWGFAEVVASRASDTSVGERVFGYLPMSAYLRLRPERTGKRGFRDTSEHRRTLPAAYQQYEAAPGGGDPKLDDAAAVLRPLFGTGFLIDAWLQSNAQFGARQVVFSSASSKTALGAAFMLSKRTQRDFQIVGLTSARNRAFCERTGYYDRVLEYGELSGLSPDVPSAFIDMAGDRDVLHAVHHQLGSGLRSSTLVGATHRKLGLSEAQASLPGPTPSWFFAPSEVEVQHKALGPQEFARRYTAAQQAFADSSANWLEIVRGSGRAAIESNYRTVLDGRAQPHQGIILSP